MVILAINYYLVKKNSTHFLVLNLNVFCIDLYTVKHGYSEQAYNELTLTYK